MENKPICETAPSEAGKQAVVVRAQTTENGVDEAWCSWREIVPLLYAGRFQDIVDRHGENTARWIQTIGPDSVATFFDDYVEEGGDPADSDEMSLDMLNELGCVLWCMYKTGDTERCKELCAMATPIADAIQMTYFSRPHTECPVRRLGALFDPAAGASDNEEWLWKYFVSREYVDYYPFGFRKC